MLQPTAKYVTNPVFFHTIWNSVDKFTEFNSERSARTAISWTTFVRRTGVSQKNGRSCQYWCCQCCASGVRTYAFRPFTSKLLFSRCRLLHRADPRSNQKILSTRNSSGHGQNNLETTYHADFPPPYPYEMKTVAHSEYADKVNQFRAYPLIISCCYRALPNIQTNPGDTVKWFRILRI